MSSRALVESEPATLSPGCTTNHGTVLGISRGTDIAVRSSRLASETGYSRTHLSSILTLESGSDLVTPKHIRAWLMSSQQARPVSHSPVVESSLVDPTLETCGRQPSKPSGELVLDFSLSRTSQDSFSNLTTTGLSSRKSWPRSGTMFDGVVYRQRSAEERIAAIVCGLWPTPVASDSVRYNLGRDAALKQYRNQRSGAPLGVVLWVEFGLRLNPRFSEWMMDLPLGWSGLKPLGAASFLRWLQQHRHF